MINIVRYTGFFTFAIQEWYDTNHKQIYNSSQKAATATFLQTILQILTLKPQFLKLMSIFQYVL